MLYLEDTLTVCEGETVACTLACAPNAGNPRDLDIDLSYTLDGRHGPVSRQQAFKMR